MVETRPSGAGRWSECSAAPQFAANVTRPAPDSDPAREGTCAAWLADLTLSGKVFHPSHMIGEFHQNGWPIDDEMADHIQDYCDFIRERGGVIEAEKFVTLSNRVAGTLDCSADLLGDTLYIDDLKYGFRYVPAKGNKQLLCYAAALLALLMMNGHYRLKYVQVGIYQPRGFFKDGPYRFHVYTVEEVQKWGAWLISRAEQCHQPNPIATPGEWCQDCPAALECDALNKTVWAAFEVIQSYKVEPTDGPALSRKVKMLKKVSKMVDAVKSAAEAEAAALLNENKFVPGFAVQRKLGGRKVKVSPKLFKTITGVDPTDPNKMLSLAALKRLGVTEAQLKVLTDRPETSLKLVEIDDDAISAQFEKDE